MNKNYFPLKKLFRRNQEKFAICIAAIYLVGICIIIAMCYSCSTSKTQYKNGFGHKIAPIVSKYNKAKIHAQATENVIPK